MHLIALMASSVKDKNVYDIKKFDGLNFALRKEKIQDFLVQKGKLPHSYGKGHRRYGSKQCAVEETRCVGQIYNQIASCRVSVLHNFGGWDILSNKAIHEIIQSMANNILQYSIHKWKRKPIFDSNFIESAKSTHTQILLVFFLGVMTIGDSLVECLIREIIIFDSILSSCSLTTFAYLRLSL